MSMMTHCKCCVLLAGESLFGVQAKVISDMAKVEQDKLKEEIECMPFLITVGLKYDKINADAAKFGWKILKIDPNSTTWKKAIGLPE